ncbi:MarR family winged helix-turn-helix transcriptional regulator [Pseudohongiella acticola]|uniref:MarR family winged helix-turn-helix transcriptional regulator n=1 Tax=Pseudohongiella acticola TaxID=1524254 RepID=UPI0009F51AEB|nr:MarR family transcriptional regulator [Pseudohongiella acticola]
MTRSTTKSATTKTSVATAAKNTVKRAAKPKPSGPTQTDSQQDDADLHLRLDNQLCFPLYAASRLITRLYQPFLDPLGLTYPQYIVLMILWEDAPCTVSHIGKRALLATNTVTPLLKRLEVMGYIERTRNPDDERVVTLSLTRKGKRLKQQCACIPRKMFERAGYPLEEGIKLKQQLDDLIRHLQ